MNHVTFYGRPSVVTIHRGKFGRVRAFHGLEWGTKSREKGAVFSQGRPFHGHQYRRSQRDVKRVIKALNKPRTLVPERRKAQTSWDRRPSLSGHRHTHGHFLKDPRYLIVIIWRRSGGSSTIILSTLVKSSPGSRTDHHSNPVHCLRTDTTYIQRPKPGEKKNRPNGTLIRTSQGMRDGWRAQCTPPIRRNSDPCQVPRKPVRGDGSDHPNAPQLHGDVHTELYPEGGPVRWGSETSVVYSLPARTLFKNIAFQVDLTRFFA